MQGTLASISRSWLLIIHWLISFNDKHNVRVRANRLYYRFIIIIHIGICPSSICYGRASSVRREATWVLLNVVNSWLVPPSVKPELSPAVDVRCRDQNFIDVFRVWGSWWMDTPGSVSVLVPLFRRLRTTRVTTFAVRACCTLMAGTC